jgi:hypothetical protein
MLRIRKSKAWPGKDLNVLIKDIFQDIHRRREKQPLQMVKEIRSN